jgi:hypothetical protein
MKPANDIEMPWLVISSWRAADVPAGVRRRDWTTEEFGFTRWVMHATVANGSFELDGMDRARVRDGLVCENYVFFDSAQCDAFVGGRPAAMTQRRRWTRLCVGVDPAPVTFEHSYELRLEV